MRMPSLPVFALGALLIGGLVFTGLYQVTSNRNNSTAAATSDRGSIVADFAVGGDPWIGYAALGSSAMQSALRAESIAWRYQSPKVVDYTERMRQVRDGELDFAVVTVGANLLSTSDFNRGGVSVAVLDQSTGGDALVCNHTRIKTVDDLSNTADWKVAFTANSPSHTLLRAIGNDFGVDAFLEGGAWRVETDGSAAALAKLQAGEVDCAVLWQPDVTRAIRGSNSLSKVFSSADVDGLIVDVLLVHRSHLLPTSPVRPHIVTVLDHYFKTVRRFEKDPEFALQQATAYLREFDGGTYTETEVVEMMAGVTWVNLTENAESWFGVGGESPYFKLEDAHDFARSIIRADEQYGSDFGRYFRWPGIIEGEFVGALYDVATIDEHNATITNPLALRFKPLPVVQWNALTAQGTLRSRRIVFRPGSLVLEDAAVAALGEAMEDFKRYPRSRLEIQVGHGANAADTEARVSATRTYLVETYGIDEHRVRARVLSEAETAALIPRREGEGRAYRSRLREVRLVLVRETEDS